MSTEDDRRLKDLADGMAAMSPEPPPFPEEVLMSGGVEAGRKWSPFLVFAGAALLVMALAAVPLLLSGDLNGAEPSLPTDVAVAGTSDPTVATTQAGTSVPSADTTIDSPGAVVYETVVYLVTEPANSYTGNPALVPFHTVVTGEVDANVLLLTLQLLANPDQTVEPPMPGFWNAIPPGVEVHDVTSSVVAGDTVLVLDMNEEFLEGAGGLLADITMLNQLVYTATAFNREARVLFMVNGQPFEAFGTEGIVLTDPLSRDDLLDSLNSIVITEPLIIGGDELPRVSGVANVFEAAVSLQLVWAESGEVVYEDFTTATCGSGCWGEFSFTLDTPIIQPGQLAVVFWSSPEDGSIQDAVTYPVGADGEPWDLFPLDPN